MAQAIWLKAAAPAPTAPARGRGCHGVERVPLVLMPMATMAEWTDTAVAAVQLAPWCWRHPLHCGAAQVLRAHGHRGRALLGGLPMVLHRCRFAFELLVFRIAVLLRFAMDWAYRSPMRWGSPPTSSERGPDLVGLPASALAPWPVDVRPLAMPG